MVFNVVCFFAAVLMAQSASAACCYGSSALVNAPAAFNGLGYGNGILNSAAYNTIRNVAGLGYNGYGNLDIASGSPNTPNGISVLAENLELAGPVAVSGSMPFAGSVGICGTVPTCGSAGVSYSTAPGAGLTSSGCGAGLAGTGYAGAGLANGYALGNNGFGLIGARSGCGCN